MNPLHALASRLLPRRSSSPFRDIVLAAASLLLLVLATPASAAPEVDLHDLTWYVHVDLINPGAGEDLAYWQGVIDAALANSNKLLEGQQGPNDAPCCSRLESSVSVAPFGSPNDGLDFVDTQTDQDAIAAIGSGSRAFLVDSTEWCNGFSPGAIGCALVGGCANPNDDPNLWMYATVDAFDDGTLGSVIAHERGHNACLPHVGGAPCQLMQGTVLTPGLGACLSGTECSNYRAARTELASGLECSCHDDSAGILADGAYCTEGTGGSCSGGLCGSFGSDAGVQLMAASDPGDLGGPPEDALRVSALSGDWTNLGQMSPQADDVRGMAFAHDSDTLYGVVPTTGADSIVTIEPSTGDIQAVVGTINNGSSEIISMAYDPGSTSAAADDRLVVLEVDASDLGLLLEIDPALPSAPSQLGALGYTSASQFPGMAYDSINDRLVIASRFGPTGFFQVDLASCTGFSCSRGPLSSWPLLAWDNASLAFSRDSGKLYLIGNLTYNPGLITTTFYAAIDPTTGQSDGAISLERFTAGGLAAIPTPEPGLVTGVTAGLLALTLTARRRRNHAA